MTLRKALEIIESEDVVSVEEILEAHAVIESHKKPIKDPENSRRAYHKLLMRRKEESDLRNEIRKYWKTS